MIRRDLLLRGRGADIGIRAPLWFVRAGGATLGVSAYWLGYALGIWSIVGVPGWIAQLAALLLGALIAPTAMGATLWLLNGMMVFVLMLVMYTPVVRGMAAPFVRADLPTTSPIDAVVVLSGSITDEGRVKGQALDRLITGVTMAKRRHVSELALSVVTRQKSSPVPNSEADQRALVGLMAPELSVRFVHQVYSTHDEALAFAALAQTNGWKRVILVTSPTHTRRACATFENVGLAVECHAADARDYSLFALQFAENRRLAFQDIGYEWVAMRVYRWRGWIR